MSQPSQFFQRNRSTILMALAFVVPLVAAGALAAYIHLYDGLLGPPWDLPPGYSGAYRVPMADVLWQTWFEDLPQQLLIFGLPSGILGFGIAMLLKKRLCTNSSIAA